MLRIVLLTMLAVLAGTMGAPRDRESKRVEDAEYTEPTESTTVTKTTETTPQTTTSTRTIICNMETPCGWTVYTPVTKTYEYYMKNNYCVCGPDLECYYYDDDISAGAFVHRCQKPFNTTTLPGQPAKDT